jgi:SAM-dependent methyltransferase
MRESRSTEKELIEAQYRDAANLDARSALHARFSTNPYGWYRWIMDQIALGDDMQVLEVGCGTGSLWQGQLQRIPKSCQVTLSDLSAGMVAQAQTNITDSRFSFRALDAQSLPYEDASFDVVVANHMLYHVPDLEGTLRELTRVLKPGGYLHATTIDSEHMSELAQWTGRFAPDADPWGGMFPGQFLLEQSADCLKRYLGDVQVRLYKDGLSVTEAEPLVAYLLSTPAKEILWPHLTDLVATVQEEIAQSGAICISKISGMALGRKSA